MNVSGERRSTSRMRRYSASAPATAVAACFSTLPSPHDCRLDNQEKIEEVVFEVALEGGRGGGKRGAGGTRGSACGFTLLAAARSGDFKEVLHDEEVGENGAT